MKYSILSMLILGCSASLADSGSDPLDREVYLIDSQSMPIGSKPVATPLVDRPENIISLDDEFPALFTKSALRQKQQNTRSPLSIQSPLTSTNAVLPQSPNPIGSLTHMRPKTVSDYDPLMCPVKWQWSNTMSVGKAVKVIAEFIGYRLIIREPVVGQVYSMPLPFVHRNVKNIEAWAALELLGGPGLMVVIDPASRTVMHRVREKYLVTENDKKHLPRCASDLTFAESPVGTETGVLIVEGKKCIL